MKKVSAVSRIMTAVAMLAATVGLAMASAGGSDVTADQALQKLLEGNKRYVDCKLGACAVTDTQARQKLAKSQHPYAIILSCSDSRVPPELVFDQSLGEIFVVRVAGNVLDPVVTGSVEYAAEHLGAPLVMVMGHERCGAVTAAVDNYGKKTEGNVGVIVRAISPSVRKAKQIYTGGSKEELVKQCINVNTKGIAAALPRQSKIIGELVKEGKLKIVAAKYDLDDGKVTILK